MPNSSKSAISNGRKCGRTVSRAHPSGGERREWPIGQYQSVVTIGNQKTAAEEKGID
jgi:hypothetical protein